MDGTAGGADGPHFDEGFRHGLGQLLAWRRDVRHFRHDPLPPGLLDELLALAQLAPSVGNAQPWRFVTVDSPALRAALADHADAEALRAEAALVADAARLDLYRSLKLHGLREAPGVLAVFSDDGPEAGHGLGIATMPEALTYSTVMAIHTLWLAARTRGIGLGWVSIVDPAAVRAMLDLPDRWRMIALLCIGYPLAASDVPELERRGWQGRQDWRVNVVAR
ncbi:MAG: 5,6-dimethylbenzimidazole synthase [Sphingomonas sp.]|nr:5,6-dimethylbenzimidazole synthase [Sphingomonas sp.]MDX3886218.1 5,6-dimethylbenzimidazole synthase [Sphingomonas sp.]